jgi:hypothetical protein
LESSRGITVLQYCRRKEITVKIPAILSKYFYRPEIPNWNSDLIHAIVKEDKFRNLPVGGHIAYTALLNLGRNQHKVKLALWKITEEDVRISVEG